MSYQVTKLNNGETKCREKMYEVPIARAYYSSL